jgi:hypothetical protein
VPPPPIVLATSDSGELQRTGSQNAVHMQMLKLPFDFASSNLFDYQLQQMQPNNVTYGQ